MNNVEKKLLSKGNGALDAWDPKTLKKIAALIKSFEPKHQPFPHSDIVKEIMVTALKAVQSQIGRGDLKLLSRSLRELRYAFKIFQNYRGVRKVTIFGSARTTPKDPAYKIAREFSRKITQLGYMIITGAGPGIMEAGNRGATPGKHFGVNIRLPFEQFPNKYIARQPTYIDCRYFFTRKLVFVKETNAVVFFPGGFGTLDEAFEILTLVQTGKADPVPVVFVDKPKGTFWKKVDSLIKNELLRNNKISKEDVTLYRIVTSVDEAVKEIIQFYRNYHSLRYVNDKLVLRFQHHITKAQLNYVNTQFQDILASGTWANTLPLAEEENQPDLAHLPRLVGKFNRVNNGRLRELIDYMNNG